MLSARVKQRCVCARACVLACMRVCVRLSVWWRWSWWWGSGMRTFGVLAPHPALLCLYCSNEKIKMRNRSVFVCARL